MAIMASRGGTYTPAPEGSHDAVFCDVVDLGMVDGTYGKSIWCKSCGSWR